MKFDTGDIPFVEFSHEELEKCLSAEGEDLGRLNHEGIDYWFLGPVGPDSQLWKALEEVHRSGEKKIIAFLLVPEHTQLTIAYEAKIGRNDLDKMVLQGMVERVMKGVQLSLMPA